MIELINYSSINPAILGFSFLVLGGVFSWLGGAVKTAVKTATSLAGLGGTGGASSGATVSKSSGDASALAKKKLQLAKAKAATKVAKAKAKTAVAKAQTAAAASRAKLLKTILMVGGGVVLLFAVFFMAKGGRK